MIGTKNKIPLSFLFSVLTKSYVGALNKKCESLKIDRYHYTLTVIYNAKGKITQQDLADFLQIDKASVVRIVDFLVKQKLIKRETNSNDRRQHFLVVTETGVSEAKQIEIEINKMNKIALKGFSVKEVGVLFRALQKMETNLSELPSDKYFLNIRKIKNEKK